MSTSAIVVGINGGEESVAALEFAMKEASLRKTHVLALMCWPTEARRDDSGAMRCRSHESASEILEHVVAEASIHDPHHVPIVREVSQSLAGPALVAAAGDADLLVLGSTGHRAGIRRHVNGTIGHCLEHSRTPVLVVPCPPFALDEVDIEIDLHQSPVGR